MLSNESPFRKLYGEVADIRPCGIYRRPSSCKDPCTWNKRNGCVPKPNRKQTVMNTQLAAANKIRAQARRRSVSTTRAATKIASMARFRAARNHALRLRCKNDVDLSLDPLTPGQRTFRLQQGQCLTLKDAMGLWMMAMRNDAHYYNLFDSLNPYTRGPIDSDKLYDWIMEMIQETAPLRLIDEWLQKIIHDLHDEVVAEVDVFQADEMIPNDHRTMGHRMFIQQLQDKLREMINISERISTAARNGRYSDRPSPLCVAWPIIRRAAEEDDVIDIIQDFWNYTEGNYEFVHGAETARVRQMPDNLL